MLVWEQKRLNPADMNQRTKCEFLSDIKGRLRVADQTGRKAVTFREDFLLEVMELDGRGGAEALAAVCEELARETSFIVTPGTNGNHQDVINFVRFAPLEQPETAGPDAPQKSDS